MSFYENNILNRQLPKNICSMFEENRIFHAIVFEGDDLGRLKEYALAFAGRIMCEGDSTSGMCGSCIHCQKVLKQVHKDVIFLSSTNGNYTKEAIRNMRIEVFKTPVEGKAKVYIFERIEDMSEEVQNLLLKIIEEPPANTYFVMTSKNRYLLLNTIVSRVVSVNIQPLSVADCEKRLKLFYPNNDKLHEIAIITNGNYDEAEKIVTDEKIGKKYMQCVKAFICLCKGDRYNFLSNMYSFEKDRKSYDEAINIMLSLLKNNEFMEKFNLKSKKKLRLYDVLNNSLEKSSLMVQLQILSILIVENSCNI